MGLNKFCAVFALAFLCHAAEGASILAVFSSLSYTDHLVYRGYVSLLAARGHTVVVMTPYPGQFQYPELEKIMEIDVGQDSTPYWEEYRKLTTNTDDYYPRLKALNELSVRLAIAQLKSKPMTALLVNPNIKFDLVITEADMPLMYALAEKYQAPHIAITTSSGKIHQHESKGNPVHPVLYPDVNALSYRNASGWDKLNEYYRHYQTNNEYYNNYLPLCDLAAKKLLGLKRSLQEVEYDIDLLFIANNPSLVGNRPSSPNVVYVDRLQMKPDLKIPQDLLAILDQSTKGVIYFSVGAIQEAEQLSTKMLQTMADAFGELPFTVLWKIGNTTMIKKTNNVITNAWFPQQQLLSHPNVKAFITHGGARSLEEALSFGVPIIGLPLVKSRKVFIGEITRYGAGEILDLYNLEKENVKSVITAVATDPKYKKSAIILRDQAFDSHLSGQEKAVWWTEYLIHFGSARLLRTSAVGVTFSKYYMLDVLGYLSVVLLVVFYLVYVLIALIVKRLRKRFLGKSDDSKGQKFKAL